MGRTVGEGRGGAQSWTPAHGLSLSLWPHFRAVRVLGTHTPELPGKFVLGSHCPFISSWFMLRCLEPWLMVFIMCLSSLFTLSSVAAVHTA